MGDVDSVAESGLTKANAIKRTESALQAKYEANPHDMFEVRAVEMEKHFEKLCYQMIKINSKLNGSSVSLSQLQEMSVYSFYTLKGNLLSDKSKG